jgi:glutathione gamma-glutamylcysteinyltransferase
LNWDPKRTWKGVWRWVTEETLQCASQSTCGHSGEKVKNSGMNFNEFEAFASCHNVSIRAYRPSQENHTSDIKHFRDLVKQSCSQTNAKEFIICNFSRKVLSQTGDGHFSPLAGYNERHDMVLILDVARFKYPPFWVNVNILYDAMCEVDNGTSLSRGYFVISHSTNS